MKKRQCILIFGMHRSGTSAFAGLLQELGIRMGQLMDASYDNPKGFFENKETVILNDEILNSFGQSWDSLVALPNHWGELPRVLRVKEKIKTFLVKEFKGIDLFAIKDPRFSLTLPIWKEVFAELNIEIKQCVLLRHPYEVAHSLGKRNAFPKEKSVALWLKYQMNAELVSRGNDRYFIPYASLLNAPETVLQSLQLPKELTLEQLKQVASSFIDTKLRHHQVAYPIKGLYVKAVYQLFLEAAKISNDPQLLVSFDELRQAEEYRLIIRQAPLIATLRVDYGNGFGENPSSHQHVKLDTTQLSFSLEKEIDINPKILHFYPINTFATVQVKRVRFLDAQKKELKPYQIDFFPLVSYQNQAVFNKDSFVEIRLSADKYLAKSMVVDLVYLKLNNQAAKDIKKVGEKYNLLMADSNNKKAIEWNIDKEIPKSSFWVNFAKTGLKHPFRFIQQINKENFRILRRALANESPAMILKNLKKLLQRKEGGQDFLEDKNFKPPLESNTIEYETAYLTPPAKSEDQSNLGNLLYVFQDLPDYDRSSGGKRALRILELLSAEFEVYVFSLGKKPVQYVKTLQVKGIHVLSTTDYRKIKAASTNFKAIVFSFYRTYHESKRILKLYPQAKIIIDTIDLNWLREERSLGIWEGLTKERVAKNKVNEIQAYQSVDIVWAVTEEDKLKIQTEVPTANVRVVSNVHEPILTDYQDNGTNNLLFIGNYHHYPNISAVKKLALDIFPKVKLEIPDVQLLIAGSNAPQEIIDLAKEDGIIYKGFIAESDMDDLYRDTFLSVSPLLVGAGIKGKICESIAYMTPVVTNDIGNEGINLIHEEEGLITELEEMSELLIQALKRSFDFSLFTKKAQEKLFQLVGSQVVKERMLLSIFPEVTICIVTWNRLDLLKKCLNSIKKFTAYPNYKVLVYSNACSDGTATYLTKAAETDAKIIPILAEENSVFVRPNNQMMMQFPENDVVLLNNDVCVTENWLLELHNTAYSSSDYGVVGSKLLYPNGTLQEFGSEIYADGTGVNRGKGDNPKRKRYNEPIETGYVSGCSMYIKRSTINNIGVFDDQFHPCYFEDADYCYTAKEHGLRTIVTPHSIVYHDEGGTAGTDTNTSFKKFQVINKEKFLAKHKGKLRK